MATATTSATGDTGVRARHNGALRQADVMTTLLQIDFPSAGPFGAQMSEAYADLAAGIATQPGLLWKIWTENAPQQTAGGVYLFSDEASAQAYAAMHTKRLEGFGVTGAGARFFDVNEPLTAITRGPVVT